MHNKIMKEKNHGTIFEKAKEAKVTTFLVLPKELLYLVDLAIKAIDSWQIEYEIEFKIGEVTHQIELTMTGLKHLEKRLLTRIYVGILMNKNLFR